MKLLLTSILFLLTANLSFALTDEEAIALGMTPLDEYEKSVKGYDGPIDEFEAMLKAKVVVVVDKSIRKGYLSTGQTAKVFVDGKFLSEYNVSTGSERVKKTSSGKKYIAATPRGYYRPKKAYTTYQSRAFLGARMDYAVFFNRGIALHSTTKNNYSKLGTRASGGCVRFTLEDAKEINELIVSTGTDNLKLKNSSIKAHGRKLKRYRYRNRILLEDVELDGTLKEEDELIKTYDALIVVKGF